MKREEVKCEDVLEKKRRTSTKWSGSDEKMLQVLRHSKEKSQKKEEEEEEEEGEKYDLEEKVLFNY